MQLGARAREYFDYAATTPVDARVAAAMPPYYADVFGNPGALHSFGQEASGAVFRARRTIAAAIGADYREIIVTGSATEANNLALRGFTQTVRRLTRIGFRRDPRAIRDHLRPRVIVSSIEHESVLATVRDLEREGAEVKILPVSREGIVRVGELQRLLNDRAVLVSVMYANNEVGTIQPISEIAEMLRNFRNEKFKIQNPKSKSIFHSSGYPLVASGSLPLFHTDAVQAFQYFDCNVDVLGADMMTLSAHKIYGPKGIGALYVRQATGDKRHETSDRRQATGNVAGSMSRVAVSLSPVITGGGQEFGLRSGTENVPAIVGFAKAVEIAGRMRAREAARVERLRDRFLAELAKRAPAITLNGGRKNRLPNNVNIYVPGIKAEELALALDLRGFAVSPGPACAARSAGPSHVLRAMGFSQARARESIRITFGRPTRQQSVDRLLRAVIQLTSQRTYA